MDEAAKARVIQVIDDLAAESERVARENADLRETLELVTAQACMSGCGGNGHTEACQRAHALLGKAEG